MQHSSRSKKKGGKVAPEDHILEEFDTCMVSKRSKLSESNESKKCRGKQQAMQGQAGTKKRDSKASDKENK